MKRKGATIEIEEKKRRTSPIIAGMRNQEGLSSKFAKAISEEIIMEILTRLPVLSLQRFKCVSTFWDALISDPYFKMKHLNYAKNDHNSQKLLACQHSLFDKEVDMYTFYSSSLSSVQVVEDEQKLDCPSNYKPVGSKICSSSDGLVLLYVCDAIDNQLLLWNPSTRESIVLPYAEPAANGYVFGFGYDTTSDDYKILIINQSENDSESMSAKILALKSGCWRKIDKYPTAIQRVKNEFGCGMDTLAFVHGAFHWLGRLSQNYVIVSFNISNEVYGEIPLLERMSQISNTSCFDQGVIVLREMLCFHSTHQSGRGRIFKLLVMKYYGVKESWTQILTIEATDFFQATPKYMFVDGEVLLLCRHLGSFAFVTSRGPFDSWPDCFILKQGIVYTESLISPRLLI